MTAAFDPRIVRVGIEIDGSIQEFENLAIYASGVKYCGETLAECEVTLYNLKKDTRDYLITKSSPFLGTRKPGYLTLDVGRQSYGTFRLFEGDVFAGNPTQPPDIGVTFKSLILSSFLGLPPVSVHHPAQTSMRHIAQGIADDLGLTLDFQATDKSIANYSFTGAAPKQLQKLNEFGVVAFVDNKQLVVADKDKPLDGQSVLISETTGMIGIPEVTEQGIRVVCLINNSVRAGGSITIKSELNPAANGEFTIYRLSFAVSNRDRQFYYLIDGRKLL